MTFLLSVFSLKRQGLYPSFKWKFTTSLCIFRNPIYIGLEWLTILTPPKNNIKQVFNTGYFKDFYRNRHTSLLNDHINTIKISIVAASYVKDLQFYSYLEQTSWKPK